MSNSILKKFLGSRSILLTAVIAISFWGLAGTAQGQIYVVHGGDVSFPTVGEYNLDGSVVNASLISGLNYGPGGIAVSGTDIYLSTSYFDNSIAEYTTSGSVVNASLISNLDSPDGIGIFGSELYVTNTRSPVQGTFGSIGVYNLDGSTVNASLTTNVAGPNSVAVSGTYMMVANSDQSALGIYNTSGATLNHFAQTFGSNVPSSLALSGNDVFVAISNGVVGEYTITGSVVNASLITGLNRPVIAVSGTDLYVGSGTEISLYNTSGQLLDASLVTIPDGVGAFVVVPEASTWVLLAAGACLLIALRRIKA